MNQYFENNIAKFADGGQASNLQQQVSLLVQAAIAGNQEALQQVLAIMDAALKGDQLAVQIATMIQEEIKRLQAGQTPAARYGSKLAYIHKLNTGCDVDEELVYLAKGGHICAECVKKALAAEKTKMDKCGGKAKKAACGTKVSKACGGKKFFKDGKRICK